MIRKTLTFIVSWVAVPAALIALIFQFQAGILAICFYALFILLVVSRLMTLLWLRPLQCERELSDDAVAVGETVKVLVKLRNPSFWPILWMYVEETLPAKMPAGGTTKRLLFLPPRRSFHLHYSLTLTRRGCHQLGPLILESGDVFGLFRKCWIVPRLGFVTAVPPYRVIEEFQVGQQRHLGDLFAERSIFEDPTRIRGIREYRRGDSLRRIHWKCSAHRAQLLSKEYDSVLEAGATVVLDSHRDSWAAARPTDPAKPSHEKAIEIACTICRYLCDGGWKVGFFSNGRDPLGLPGITVAQARATDSLGEALRAASRRRRDDRLAPVSIRARRSPDQFSVIHENLGRIELSDGLPIETLLMGELPYIDRQQVLVVLTGRVNESFIVGMLRARELGYRMMVFVVDNNQAHDAAFEAFVPCGIEVFNMDAEWRLKEIATGRRVV